MYWEQVKEQPSAQFKRLTGVQKKTFKLLVKAVKAHDEKVVRKKGNHRSRPFSLCIEDQVLLTLMYYREYRTQLHIGFTYGISESATCRTIHRIETIVAKVKELQLPGKKVLSGRKQEMSVVVIDATEMPIERPKKSKGSTIVARKSGIR
jgi:hypothetical protein